MTVEAEEMQHHSRLLRGQRDQRQWHFGILAVARRIQRQRNVPTDHSELHAFLVSVRQILIDHLAHGAEHLASIGGKCGEIFGYGRSCHVESTQTLFDKIDRINKMKSQAAAGSGTRYVLPRLPPVPMSTEKALCGYFFRRSEIAATICGFPLPVAMS